MIARLRSTILRRLADLLIDSDTFRHRLGELNPDYDRRYLRAVGLLRDASDEEAVFVRDLVQSGDADIVAWVLHETDRKKGGYFVEFGAADGLIYSNTLLLEKDHGWRGIVAEPNPDWQADLARNRGCAIDHRCVFTTTGDRVKFAATKAADLATLVEYTSRDGHARSREAHRVVDVETVSLNDLLSTHGAPHDIDFISIDTEGSEYDILTSFDFDGWNVRLFAVEHNQTPDEQKIDALMQRHGYERRYRGYPINDAWYRRNP
ncbi:MAG TPA: FkbM family methyltransferase [Stellaceae bacterium]|jgi:FkbM family methyltransferase